MASNSTNTSGGAASGGAPPARRDQILDLAKYVDQPVRVKFFGGREVQGVLKGYDPLVNLVLDECVEFLRDASDEYRVTEQTRKIGLVVCRGTSVVLVYPAEGTQEVANPFVVDDE